MYARQTIELHSAAPDNIAQDAPLTAWNTVQNVYFRNRESYRAAGDTPTLAPGRVVRTMVFVQAFDINYWVYATEDGIYAHDGTTEFDITPLSWVPSAVEPTYTSCVLNGVAYLNASDRDPVYWDGTTANVCKPLPDWPLNGRCIALRAHRNFLFAVGMISEGAERVRWSDAAEAGTVPDSWTPTATNFAGFVDLAPLAAPCFDAAEIKGQLLVYKGESVWELSFVSNTSVVFNARKRFNEIGVIAPNAVTIGPDDNHLFVGNDGDIYRSDGVFLDSILDGRAQRAFYNDLQASGERTFSAATLMREKLGLISYPIASEDARDRLISYDFVTGDIGYRDLPETYTLASGPLLLPSGQPENWDDDAQIWDDDFSAWNDRFSVQTIEDVIIGSELGTQQISGDGQDFVFGPVTALLQKLGAAFGDAQARKSVRRIWPKITGTVGTKLVFRIGGQEESNSPVSWGPPVEYIIGESNQIDVMVQGRFMALEVQSTGGAPWRMGTVDVEYRNVGKW